MLEELKEAYGKPDYVFQSINIGQNIQKEDWFTQYGPNGRIPVLIDHDAGDLGTCNASMKPYSYTTLILFRYYGGICYLRLSCQTF